MCTVTLYETPDGKTFHSEAEAEEHETVTRVKAVVFNAIKDHAWFGAPSTSPEDIAEYIAAVAIVCGDDLVAALMAVPENAAVKAEGHRLPRSVKPSHPL